MKSHYNEKINDIKNHIIISFNNDFTKGKQIDSSWLKSIIKEIHNRPKGDNDFTTYFTPFISVYIEESKSRLNLRTGKKISASTIKKYSTTLNTITEYEELKKYKFRLTEIDLKFHNDFTKYLKIDKKYGSTYISKIISDIKTMVRDAKGKGYDIHPEIESSKFTFRKDIPLDTYLNNKEINIIFKHNLEDNDRLDNARDLFIIGLRTGLRISDLKRINDFLFKENKIVIASTEKTGASAEIPIHPQIKKILKKRNNKLPRIISDQKFNLYVKDLCEDAGFTQKILGNLKNPETNRKERGYFEKYKLISSHTCRRSFATNLYGKIDNKTIMAITTHKSHSQFLSYVKTTHSEHVEKLAEFWHANS